MELLGSKTKARITVKEQICMDSARPSFQLAWCNEAGGMYMTHLTLYSKKKKGSYDYIQLFLVQLTIVVGTLEVGDSTNAAVIFANRFVKLYASPHT